MLRKKTAADYDTEWATPSGSSAPTFVVASHNNGGVTDTFTQANGVLSSTNWTAFGGTLPNVSSNRAVSPASGGSNVYRNGLSTTSGAITMKLYGEGGIIFRQTDSSNYNMIYQTGTDLHRYSIVGGSITDTVIGSVVAASSGSPVTLGVSWTPNGYTVSHNGTNYAYFASTLNAAGVRSGFYIWTNSGVDDWTYNSSLITVTGLPSGYSLALGDGSAFTSGVTIAPSSPTPLKVVNASGQVVAEAIAAYGDALTYAAGS